MQDEINTLLGLFNTETSEINTQQKEIIEALNEVEKKAKIQEFLTNKYKSDYEKTVNFLNKSIVDIEHNRQQLLKVNIELERFAYLVSHDLKAPIRGILGFVALLDRELGPDQNDRIKEYLTFIKKSSYQMNTLIQETLEYSKIDVAEIKLEQVNLNTTVEDITEIVVNANNDYEVKIEKTSLPTVMANKAMMHKLFQNIITNGIKYNESDCRTVYVHHKENITHHMFKIIDNGIGMDQKDKNKIFDMYTRLQSSANYEGTGIGLSICKKIIEKHKGEIHVDSELGSGSTFWLSIPK